MDGAKPRACETSLRLGVLEKLPATVQELARGNYELLETNPYPPSLHFKRIGRWSVRVGRSYRALAVEAQENLVWFWIGTHPEYDVGLSDTLRHAANPRLHRTRSLRCARR
jgi:hypothetical protein